MYEPERHSNGEFIFEEYPDFRPNVSPKEMFQLGSFGGTYWRPIHSAVNKTHYKNIHLGYPDNWWKGLTTKKNNKLTLSWDKYDKTINRYNVKVGQTLEEWENNNWISKYHPYGWVHWYCDFFIGNRSPDDRRQIDRWVGIASKKGRFRKWLITLIIKNNGSWDDFNISPKIRQTLQHWGYRLTREDFEIELYNRNNRLSS